MTSLETSMQVLIRIKVLLDIVSISKKLEQAQKNNRELEECQSQSSSMYDVCSPAAAQAAKQL